MMAATACDVRDRGVLNGKMCLLCCNWHNINVMNANEGCFLWRFVNFF